MNRKTTFKPKSKSTQLELFAKTSKSYGGELLKTRKGRAHGRPLSTKHTMHLVLRSSKAKGAWSFRIPKNSKKIKEIIERFAQKYGIKALSIANVGNHLHLHIKIPSRMAYKAFIRAITSAIAMAISGKSRWTKAHIEEAAESAAKKTSHKREKFWDLRPFTRVIIGLRSFLNLEDYILLNKLEGFGVRRNQAKMILKHEGSRWARSFLRTAPT